MLTQEYLKSILHYDPQRGVLTWKPGHKSGWASKLGRDAGWVSDGYRRVKIDRSCYLAHRLAWLWMTGEFPEHQIDHRDLNTLNNRFSNLRPATSYQNVLNVGLKSDNTSGIKGVFWKKDRAKWFASIKVNGRQIYLGYFDTKEDAGIAVRNKRDEVHGEFANHG